MAPALPILKMGAAIAAEIFQTNELKDEVKIL